METDVVEHRRSVIGTIAAFAARRWQVTLAFLVVVLIVGVSAFGFGLDREGFPPINTPISVVTGTYFVDDPETIDAEVVAPMERAFRSVEGVISTESHARPSSFVVVIEFESGIDSAVGTQRLLDLGWRLPEAAQVAYRPVSAAKYIGEFDALVSIVGPAETTPEKLQEQARLLSAVLEREGDIERAVVRDLLTESINPSTGDAEVRLTRFTRVALDGSGYSQAIAIGLVRSTESDLDIVGFSDLIDRSLTPEASGLDAGFEARITADFAVGIRQQLSSLTRNLLTGLIAVAIISLLLIGWRVALMTAGFMAAVMLGALGGLWAVGYSLNTITLFGLILTLGLLVDDAIVISESIDSSRDEPDPIEPNESVGVIRTALERVGSASLAGSLTTVLVFSPMLFITGILGEFIRAMPATVILTLLLSFLFSIVFIPAIARVFLLRGKPSRNPVVRAEKHLARLAGRLAAYPAGHGWKGRGVGVGLAAFAVVVVVAGGSIAGGLGFSIFPPGKDATGLFVSAEFPPGTSIEQAQKVSEQIDGVVISVLGDELDRSQYVQGNERGIGAFIDLTPIGSRATKAPEFVEQIEDGVARIEGARVTVSQIENGPPEEEFPFAVQIDVDSETVDAGQQLAQELRDELDQLQVESGSKTVAVSATTISTNGQIARLDGQRFIEVRAQYDQDNGLTGVLNQTEDVITDMFSTSDIEARGLAADALGFDFGSESDTQDDFASLGIAGLVALVLMLLLITVQFRSLAQSLLIFLAIPFSFFGVFSALALTDNPLSFLAVVGFIALIGVAVNNTILLVDSANRQRREGATAGEAIQHAVTSRFRPLVATTLTTVVGLLPLSLSDPFWESLGFTLMGGLISSTILVLLTFPAFYLGLEAVRTPARNFVRRLMGRTEIA